MDNSSCFGTYRLINFKVKINMMIPKNFENKEIGLLGLGVSGKSALISLRAGGGIYTLMTIRFLKIQIF